MRLRPTAPCRGRYAAIALALVCSGVAPAAAQPRGTSGRDGAKTPPAAGEASREPAAAAPRARDGGRGAVKSFDFTGLDLSGRMRTPQLLYFLERANEELERASLERRSFIPHLVRTVEEEAL